MLTTYALALALTLAFELPIAAGLAPGGERRRLLIDALLLNLLTHPLAVAARWYAELPLLPIEAAVWTAEAVGYRRLSGLSWGRAALLSVVANGATTALIIPFQAWMA